MGPANNKALVANSYHIGRQPMGRGDLTRCNNSDPYSQAQQWVLSHVLSGAGATGRERLIAHRCMQ